MHSGNTVEISVAIYMQAQDMSHIDKLGQSLCYD